MNRGLAALALAGMLSGCGPDIHEQEHQARTLVFQKLSLPDQPVVVGPAVVASDFAIVDWTRGGLSGGRTLLRRGPTGWTLVLCGGAPLRRRPIIESQGRVPDGAAGVLITKLLREESGLGERRDQLDRWAGLPAAVGCPEARP
ncbi:MAG TPA: copper uptake system-associated protein [Caulobacteraceae bacterium]|nr:copper uptake system-associated protein [Caulobacteraceae bacterium]